MKYIIYAMSEIALVVLGILIALKFNNWNEFKKAQKIEIQALVDLRQEFMSNKVQFDKIIEAKSISLDKNRDYISVIERKETETAKIIEARIGLGDGGIQTFNPSNGVLNTLMNTGRIDNIQNDSLKYLLTEWKDKILDYREEEESHIQFNMNNLLPYEFSLIPRPYFNAGRASFPFHSDEELRKLFRQLIRDLKYQNLILMNEGLLNSTIEESKSIEEMFSTIITSLKEEIAYKS